MPVIGEEKAKEKAAKRANALREVGPDSVVKNLSQWSKFASRDSKPDSKALRQEILDRSGKPAPTTWSNDQMYGWLLLNPRTDNTPIPPSAEDEATPVQEDEPDDRPVEDGDPPVHEDAGTQEAERESPMQQARMEQAAIDSASSKGTPEAHTN